MSLIIHSFDKQDYQIQIQQKAAGRTAYWLLTLLLLTYPLLFTLRALVVLPELGDKSHSLEPNYYTTADRKTRPSMYILTHL